jgi:hypothetical protein
MLVGLSEVMEVIDDQVAIMMLSSVCCLCAFFQMRLAPEGGKKLCSVNAVFNQCVFRGCVCVCVCVCMFWGFNLVWGAAGNSAACFSSTSLSCCLAHGFRSRA